MLTILRQHSYCILHTVCAQLCKVSLGVRSLDLVNRPPNVRKSAYKMPLYIYIYVMKVWQEMLKQSMNSGTAAQSPSVDGSIDKLV